MKVVEKKIKDLQPYINNPRLNDDAVDYVAKSIKEFGFKVPLVIDKNNVIVCGHTRYKASLQLGLDKVPCVVADDLNDEQIKAYRLADNKVGEMAQWDFLLLDKELAELDLDMEQFGFEFEEEEQEEGHADIEETEDVDSNVKYNVHRGDIYELGRHRLMCGNSTDDDDVAKLMNGEKAKILFTSPPYADLREYNGGKDVSVNNIASFIKVYEPYTDFQCVNLGMIIREREIVQYWDEYIKTARSSGYKLMSWNVWDKTLCGSVGQQHAFFPTRHEWIFVFGKDYFDLNLTWKKKDGSITDRDASSPKARRQADGSMKFSTAGDCSHEYKKMESVLALLPELGDIRQEHPATFPIGLPSEYIQAMTNVDDTVIEAFGGSGTTLMACEQLNRQCRIMELDEKYCDVILRRWEKLTGQTAQKVVT